MTPSSPRRESRNAARSTAALAAFFFLPANLSQAEKSGKSAEAREVMTAHAAAAKKRPLPRITARLGMEALSAASPVTYIPPRTRAPHKKTAPAARTEARTGACAVRPASMSAGAEKAIFMAAYKAACPISPARGAKTVPKPFPDNNTQKKSTGTSSRLRKLTPFIPRDRNKTITASPAIEAKGLTSGKSTSSPASIPEHGTNATARSRHMTGRAARPNSARIAPAQPPYFLPRQRKKAFATPNNTQENANAGRYPLPGKKRTSSAPVRKPAPIVVPTRKKAVRMMPISLMPMPGREKVFFL